MVDIEVAQCRDSQRVQTSWSTAFVSVLTIPVAHWAVLRLGSHLENEFGVLKAVDNSPEFIQEDILLDIRVIE